MPAKKSAAKGSSKPAASKAPAAAAAKAAPKSAAKSGSKQQGKKPAGKGVAEVHKKIKKNSDLNLFDSKPRNFGIGNAIPPKRDLTRYVKWPKYVKMQRQRQVLLKRIKVPPALNQFSNALDKTTASRVFALVDKYRPEDKKAKKDRLKVIAAAKASKQEAPNQRPPNVVKFGLNHVTALIEQKKAKLVLIAHDVEPIELVVWLPALCKRQGIPYAIIKGKSRLGQVVHQKKASCLAIVNVNKDDMHEFSQLQTAIKENFNDRFAEINKKWGGKQLGHKSISQQTKRQRAAEKVQAKGY